MEVNPIYPFEPISSKDVPSGPEWISQIKWDGVRVLTYFNGQDTRLFNRKLNERTNIFPELTEIREYTDSKSVIFDGEVIALDPNGNPSFHEVMRRDGIRRIDRVKQLIDAVPIYYMIFDIIFYNGQWINKDPLKERLDLLSKVVNPSERIQVVPSNIDGTTLFEVVKQHGLEGIVCKNLNSSYIIDGKNADWRKVKNYKDVIAVVGGVTYRSGTVNSLLIGLYDLTNQFVYIGHVGTGKLTVNDWKELTKLVETIKIENNPFCNKPKKTRDTAWIQPLLTVKVQFMEWTNDMSLRQPSIQAFIEKDPYSCKLNEIKEEIDGTN